MDLPSLDVGSHTVSTSMMVGPPNAMHMQTYSTEYCDISLAYKVSDEGGLVLLEGTVRESTAKGEFLHPNQTKLANAVEGVRRHLVDYLRGRMAAENIENPGVLKVEK